MQAINNHSEDYFHFDNQMDYQHDVDVGWTDSNGDLPPSGTALPAPQHDIDDIKVEYHPNSGRPTKVYHFEDYGRGKWCIISCTPGLLAWGWVTVSSISAIIGPLDAYVWQLSLTSNIAMSNAKGEDFTSDLMCLAIANARHKESNNFPGPTTTNDNPINDIPGLAMPTTPIIAPSAPAVVPSALAIVPSAPAIVVLVPANATTALNPATLLPAIPAPGPPVASESAGVAVAYEDSGPSVTAVDSEVPGVPDDVPMVVTAPSSGCWGRGRKAGMLAPVSSGPASEQATGQPKRTWKK
ncbi:hypothetical protein C8R48DRAFT_674726 [Suillus tomentosus]|nr:hypothetical protein C8R48DRAFT_674726 [Suillus tomentosus]